jgi:SAM-dependent methyltransferase
MQKDEQPSCDGALARQTGRGCPVCGGKQAELLFQQSFQALGRGGPVDAYDVVVCTACGTSFSDGIPTQAEFDDYYRELSKYEYAYRAGKESDDDNHRLKTLAELIQSIISDKSSSILEIGCANGRLLSYLREAGFANVTGIDPSPGCAHAARLLYDIPVATSTIFGLHKPDNGYDVVMTLGVFEHIRDLRRAVESIREVTRRDSRVFIGVPDASHLIAAQDAPFQEFSTEHINFFSPVSLRYLMEASGFQAVSCSSVNLELHRGVLTPAVFGLFEQSPHSRTEFPYDDSTKTGLSRYIAECRAVDEQLKKTIRQAVNGRKVVVWGVGTHTRRLLADHTLQPENITVFVDADPKYQGQRLVGIPVLSPDRLMGHSEPVLVSSYAFQREISQEIRERLCLPNELILLYDLNNSEVAHG